VFLRTVSPKLYQNGLDSALVSWTAPSGGAAVTGYTIYYQQEGGERSSVSAEASDTSTTISGLIEGAIYSINIVATSNTLPSTVTGPQTITIGTHYVHWTTQCLSSVCLCVCVCVSSAGANLQAGASRGLTEGT